jgi:hypothetical protein
VNRLLNLVENYYVKSTLRSNVWSPRDKLITLFKWLNEEFQRNQEFLARLKSGTLSETDLTQKFWDRI